MLAATPKLKSFVGLNALLNVQTEIEAAQDRLVAIILRADTYHLPLILVWNLDKLASQRVSAVGKKLELAVSNVEVAYLEPFVRLFNYR